MGQHSMVILHLKVIGRPELGFVCSDRPVELIFFNPINFVATAIEENRRGLQSVIVSPVAILLIHFP
jgi:hypothetical protein